MGDQLLKRAQLLNDKIELGFSIYFFFGLEDGQRYWGEAVYGGALLGGGGATALPVFASPESGGIGGRNLCYEMGFHYHVFLMKS